MDVISYLLENMKEVFFIIFEQFFCFQHNIPQFTTPPPLFFVFYLHTHQELNVGALCFASKEGKFDLAQFLISKNCPINGVHNLFVFSFFLFLFLFLFSKTLKFLFSLSFTKFHYHRMINHLWLLHVFTRIWILLNYYHKMEHISLFKFVGFFDNFLQNNSLSSFFLFFQFIINLVLGKTGKEYSSSSL